MNIVEFRQRRQQLGGDVFSVFKSGLQKSDDKASEEIQPVLCGNGRAIYTLNVLPQSKIRDGEKKGIRFISVSADIPSCSIGIGHANVVSSHPCSSGTCCHSICVPLDGAKVPRVVRALSFLTRPLQCGNDAVGPYKILLISA